MLTAQQITKFQMLYKNRFGKEISQAEALEMGLNLVGLLEVVYKQKLNLKNHEKYSKKI